MYFHDLFFRVLSSFFIYFVAYVCFTLVQLLSRIRWGQCTPEVLAELRKCQRSVTAGRGITNNSTGNGTGEGGGGGTSDGDDINGRSRVQDDGIEETQLLTHKADVLRVNEQVCVCVFVCVRARVL